MNVQDECIKIHSKFGMGEMANYKIQLLFDSEIEKVKKEYEEKLRWIPIEEKLPDIYCCEIAVRKQKYKKTEIKIFLHSGQFKQFCKNHGYTEWRYFL